MPRRFRIVVFALLATLGVGISGCADLAGPSQVCTGHQGAETCPQ